MDEVPDVIYLPGKSIFSWFVTWLKYMLVKSYSIRRSPHFEVETNYQWIGNESVNHAWCFDIGKKAKFTGYKAMKLLKQNQETYPAYDIEIHPPLNYNV